MSVLPGLLVGAAICVFPARATQAADAGLFSVSCGPGLPGDSGGITLEAGPDAPPIIRAAISRQPIKHFYQGAPQTHIVAAIGDNSGTCTASSASRFRVYLDHAAADRMTLIVEGAGNLTISGVREGHEDQTLRLAPLPQLNTTLSW